MVRFGGNGLLCVARPGRVAFCGKYDTRTWTPLRSHRGACASFCSSSAHAIDKERNPSELSCRSGETTLAQATLFDADGAANEERQQGAMDCALHRLRREWSRHAGTRGPTQFRIKPVVQSTATFADRGATIRPATNTSSDTV